jgi:hypothetical protein
MLTDLLQPQQLSGDNMRTFAIAAMLAGLSGCTSSHYAANAGKFTVEDMVNHIQSRSMMPGTVKITSRFSRPKNGSPPLH